VSEAPRTNPVIHPRYLVAKEAAEYCRMTLRSLHERTANRSIPYRRIAGMRKLLFLREELDAFLEGADLETIEKADGSLIVRPLVLEAVTV
jgi:excisionase family DNA binding protein